MTQHTLGSAITALRKQKGMTQQELADYMGVSDKAVSKWERDQSLPDIYTLAKMAHLFGVTVDQLLGTEPKPAPPFPDSLPEPQQRRCPQSCWIASFAWLGTE